MNSARKLENSAILHKQYVGHVVWVMIHCVLGRIVEVYHQLYEVAEDSDGNLVEERNPHILEKAQWFASMLGEIEVMTKSLQTSVHTL